MYFNIMLGFCLFVFFCYFAALSFAQEGAISDARFCGFQHTDDYVRTGNETYIDEFPWVAALVYKFVSDGTKAVLCTGSLINNRYVLTAAQCLTHPKASVLVAVRLGEYNIRNATDCVSIRLIAEGNDKICTKTVDFGIEEAIVHPEYNRRTRVNDIALLRLNDVVEYTDYIRPICVFGVGPRSAKTGDTLQASGWGRRVHDGEASEFKKKVPATLITNEECEKDYPKKIITPGHMCTRDLASNEEFVCQGDAGGPVMLVVGRLPQWQLEGIASWSGRCGSGRPVVYTRVSTYLAWIQKNMWF